MKTEQNLLNIILDSSKISAINSSYFFFKTLGIFKQMLNNIFNENINTKPTVNIFLANIDNFYQKNYNIEVFLCKIWSISNFRFNMSSNEK